MFILALAFLFRFCTSQVLKDVYGHQRQFQVLVSNDDGWEDVNIREFLYQLEDANISAVISAPAHDKSGHGRHEIGYNKDGRTTGTDPKDPRLNWVEGNPADAINWGIDVLSMSRFHNGKTDLAVSGPNEGNNIGWPRTGFSGTMGAARAAVGKGIPAIAFSGDVEHKEHWNEPVSMHSHLYAQLATVITQQLLESGPPFLPEGIFLNVNFPHIDKYEETCRELSDFSFHLTRLHHWYLWTPKDVEICGKNRLPQDGDIVGRPCSVSISVAKGKNGYTAEAGPQEDVLRRLKPLLSCADPDRHLMQPM